MEKDTQAQQEVATILRDLVDPPVRCSLATRFGSWFAIDDPAFDDERWAEWCNVPLSEWIPAWAWEKSRLRHIREQSFPTPTREESHHG